jgi:hypothetical protein
MMNTVASKSSVRIGENARDSRTFFLDRPDFDLDTTSFSSGQLPHRMQVDLPQRDLLSAAV